MLSPEQVKCLNLMVTTDMKQYEIAKEIKRTEQTICAWKREPEFQAEHSKMLRSALRGAANQAMHTLVGLLKAESEQVRLNAAKDILDRAGYKPEDKVEINGNINPLAGISTEDLKKLIVDD